MFVKFSAAGGVVFVVIDIIFYYEYFYRSYEPNSLIHRITSYNVCYTKLLRSFEYTEFLDLMVRSDPEKVTDNFNTYGELILERNQIINNVQLAPGAIVQYIYPLAGNESAIGHNLLTDSKRKAFVEKAMEQKVSISQGPVKSLQGNIMVFNRKPIYIDDKRNNFV